MEIEILTEEYRIVRLIRKSKKIGKKLVRKSRKIRLTWKSKKIEAIARK